MSQRAKYNAILEETLSKTCLMYIMEIKIEAMHFDRNNNLYPTGEVTYWKEFDLQFKKFDEQMISLCPEPVISRASHQTNQQEDKTSKPNKSARGEQKN